MAVVRYPETRLPTRPRQAVRRAATSALLLALGGCTGSHEVLGPAEDLFHGLQGGVIAEQRPPPPGSDDPFPKIGTVPARPAAPDVVAQQRIADRLAAQRDQAEVAAANSPLTALAKPPAVPKAPATPDPNANRVLVDAAASPPAPKPAATPAAPAHAAVPDIGSVPAVPADVTSGPIPTLAPGPPPVPAGVGVDVPVTPIATTAAEPAPAPAGPPAGPVTTVLVAFTPGSATLPPSATLNLRRFALAHRGVPLTVTGHGGEVLPGSDPQARALDLALRRAQAIAASLATAGVPAANLRLRAEAAGQGGAASL